MTESNDNRDARPELVESHGAWPFVTYRVFRTATGGRHVWQSRHHRKRLHEEQRHALRERKELLRHAAWSPGRLNWWIGAIFALGSMLFILGSLLVLVPGLADRWSFDSTAVNLVFFIGSIPFTTAAYLQLFEAANSGELTADGTVTPGPRKWLGWRPHDAGWLSGALQFAGTLLFNINTLDAMHTGLNWLQQDLEIWAPDFAGSVLFLASGYLAFLEICHAHFAWKPDSLSWWVTFVNLLGCVAFMISAFFAFVPPQEPSFDAAAVSVVFTLIGAICFLAGSLLMLPETAIDPAGQ